MTATVTLLTDRNAFHDTWRAALEAAGLSVLTLTPDALGSLSAAQPALVIDAAAAGLDEDGLLEAVGFALACRSVTCVDASGSEAPIDDVVDEMCRGLVARSAADIVRLAQSLARRLDELRQNKFEFVTISPREGEVLAILGDGGSVLLKRPLSPEDDGSDVESIDLEDNATRAMLGLALGEPVLRQRRVPHVVHAGQAEADEAEALVEHQQDHVARRGAEGEADAGEDVEADRRQDDLGQHLQRCRTQIARHLEPCWINLGQASCCLVHHGPDRSEGHQENNRSVP